MNGRTCLITGATDGIGKETAIGMAKNGYNLILIGRNEEKGKKVSDEIRKIADSIDIDFFTADLILMKEVSRVADEVCQKYDRIDVLINNAGSNRINKPPEETSLAEWKSVIDTNITGTFLCCREARQGHDPSEKRKRD